jgi:predicted RecB family nuclease
MTCSPEGVPKSPDDLAAVAERIEEERRLLDEQEGDALVTLLRLAGQVAGHHQELKGGPLGPAMTASYRRALLRVGCSGLRAVVEGDTVLRLRLPPDIGKLEWLGRLDGDALRQLLRQMGPKQARRDEIIRAVKEALGQSRVLGAAFADDDFDLRLDGLKRAAGPSKLGDFHYVPMLFQEGGRVRGESRLLLEVCALLLAQVQGRAPAYGVVWPGDGCRAARVRLSPDPRKARQALDELRRRGAEPPRLILNGHCQRCEFRRRCHEQAAQEDNLSLLRGMTEKEARGYARRGILTLTQLAHTFRPRRKGRRKATPRATKHYHALQALAVRDRRIYVLGTPQLRDAPVKIYLDVEGKPDEGFDYLIGLIVVRGGAQERSSYWADTKEQEADIFERFLDEVARHDDFLVFCYGGYERAFLRRMRKTTRRKKLVDRALGALVNVLALVYAHVYFPCYSNGLKDVAACLGCAWSEPDASGALSLVWRARWEAGRDEAWKARLTTYNMEDCAALKKVAEAVHAIAGQQAPAGGAAAGQTAGPQVTWVQELDRWANDRKWGKIDFVHPDFAAVNGCAYFDYQRERVYARTSPTIKKNLCRRKKGCRLKLRGARQVLIVGSRCPACGGREVETGVKKGQAPGCRAPRLKMAFDLVRTAVGIRRTILACRSSVHRCRACGHAFVPERHSRLDKHFHGLKGWAMYQHVCHWLSLGAIQAMLEEFFGLRVHGPELHMIKGLMARYYRPTYRGLLRKLLSGPLLHIDETEVKLRTGTGYVWVLASLEEAVYLYRPTREGDFLKGLLEGFEGVLVSDFYAAYDGLPCPQQKCLVHLMRDLNQELLGQPYDDELKSVTGPFGTLLRAVVATVDEHGLKRRHLHKHRRDVAAYFDGLSRRAFRSGAAEAVRGRLLKYRDRLFTFLDHDGVPWNNNNAENAIKRFAYYREDTKGSLCEEGLGDYLVLLSVCQTCRSKGVSFLRFLMSGSKDVDAFGAGKRRRWLPALQVYPKGAAPACQRGRRPEQAQAARAEGEPPRGRAAAVEADSTAAIPP